MENLILLDISNKTLIILMTHPHIIIRHTMKDCIEGIKIISIFPHLKGLMMYIFSPLRPALCNLDENVCFVNIDDKFLQLSCDWCSIVNGIMETAKQNIIKRPELVKKIDIDMLNISDNYYNIALSERTEKVTSEQAETWCKDTFGQVTSDLLLFARIYLKSEQIELRWCPFKRSREFYYRNKDKRYIEPTNQNMYEVGKILSKYETITCNNCPRVINAEWKYTKGYEKSMFKPLLDYMMCEIREPTVLDRSAVKCAEGATRTPP